MKGRPSGDWKTGLMEDLRDEKFARRFLLAAIESGIPLQIALGKVVRAIGVKEYAAKVRMARSNLLRAIDSRQNPSLTTFNRLLKPFRLKLGLVRLDETKRRQPL